MHNQAQAEIFLPKLISRYIFNFYIPRSLWIWKALSKYDGVSCFKVWSSDLEFVCLYFTKLHYHTCVLHIKQLLLL